MKQAVVTIKYDEEKLNAVKQYMGKYATNPTAETSKSVPKIFFLIFKTPYT